MNIYKNLCTVIVGSLIAITAIPVHASAWRINDDKYTDSRLQRFQAHGKDNRDEKLQRDRGNRNRSSKQESVNKRERYRQNDQVQDRRSDEKHFQHADFKTFSGRPDNDRDDNRNRDRGGNRDRNNDRNSDRKDDRNYDRTKDQNHGDRKVDQKNYRKADSNQPPARLDKNRSADQYRERNDDRNQSREQSRDRKYDQKQLRPSGTTQPPTRVYREHEDRRLPAKAERHGFERPPTGLRDLTRRQATPVRRVIRPRHHIHYHDHYRREYRYVTGPWYYTRYIVPFPFIFSPIGYEIDILPSTYVRLYVGGRPYYYYSGTYYRPYRSGYIVVAAPIGAFVTTLPEGFIAFSIGLATYYYLNNTYYAWDDVRDGYVVVEKPAGADDAMTKATSGRLFVYPNKGQDEDQQARDRYECHRWAVSESGFDPTIEEEEYSANDNNTYRRALAACLEGRDYTVK